MPPIVVLLVEDHAVNQKVVMRMLERLGCAVDIASDGVYALERIGPQHALVLMDLSMPRCDGFEATRRIRGLQGDISRTPIVALTAHATPADRVRCLSAGMDHWLPKPVHPEDLVDVLRRFTSWQPLPQPEVVEGVLDREVVEQLAQLGGSDEPDFFSGLVAEFHDTTRIALAEAVAHHAAQRSQDVRRTMNRVKSASSTIGAVRLREACARVVEADDRQIGEHGTLWLAQAAEELELTVAALGAVGTGPS